MFPCLTTKQHPKMNILPIKQNLESTCPKIFMRRKREFKNIMYLQRISQISKCFKNIFNLMMNHEIKKQYFFRSQDNVGAYRNHRVCSLKLYPITSGFMDVQPLIFPRPDPSSRNAITFTFLQNTVIRELFSSFYFSLDFQSLFFSVLLR